MYTDFYVEAANKPLATLPLLPGEIDQVAKAVHEYTTILIDLAILSTWLQRCGFELANGSYSTDHSTLRFAPSVIAASAVAAARAKLNLQPIFPPQLAEASGLTVANTSECTELIISM